MSERETGVSCWVCRGPIIEVTEEIVDSNIMQKEVGKENPTKRVTLFCRDCGVMYAFIPKPRKPGYYDGSLRR